MPLPRWDMKHDDILICQNRSLRAICRRSMAKEQFFYPETRPIFKKLEQLSQRSGVSRGQAFEDLLTAMICALAAETKEAEYLAMVERHKKGKPGQRGIDLISRMFGELVNAMDRSEADILGDLFEGGISYGEAGQYLTPESLARLLAELSVDPDARPTADQPLLINDCCCGTGRMLLEASKVNPHAELVGQDIDARCAKISALNIGLRGKYGWVVCGNALSGETQFAYRIGSFFNETPQGLRRGVIRDVPPEQTPIPVLAERTPHKTGDLFAQPASAPAETTTERIMATIVEVPQWLARLEPRLAAMQRDQPPAVEGTAAEPPEKPQCPPPTQQTLF